MKQRIGIVATIALLFVTTLLAQSRFKPGINLFSKEQDIQLGKEAAAEVEKKMAVVKDPALNQYIQEIGKRLASAAEAGDYPYTFKLVADNSINAFALPGGPTFVHTGLITAAANEAQLAGVLAHEIAHVALRHGTNQASKAQMVQVPTALAGSMVKSGSMLGQLSKMGIGLGANSVLLKFSRGAEREADLLGTQIMAKAGYEPIEMARFFQTLEQQGGARGPEFLSDHPNPGNRVKAVQEEVAKLPTQNYGTGDANKLAQMKAAVSKVQVPATPKKEQPLKKELASGRHTKSF
jgi:predicted Zn-dependent protease